MKTGEIWNSSSNDKFVVCPVPECKHYAWIITKAHCRIAHGMEREEIAKRYGLPKEIKMRRGE